MKFFVMIALWLCYACNSNKKSDIQLNQNSLGIFSFKEKFYDFGNIHDGDTVVHSFFYTNTGAYPLIIHDISTGCGCTVVEYTKKPVMPNDSGCVFVRFSKHHDPGVHYKTIIIKANTNNPYTVLKISANIHS